MKIVRSNEEQIVSAHDRYLYGQNNNLYYNGQDGANSAYDAEVDFSYSDKQFINELAKDRQFGTSNIRPLNKERNSFTERMYQDAIEEASRIKTMGYFNQFPDVKPSNQIHSPSNINHHSKSNMHLLHKDMHNNIPKNIPKDNNSFKPPEEHISFSSKDNINPNIDFIQINDSNNGINFEQSNSTPNKYNDLLDQVSNNIKHEMATQIVDESKENLRRETKVEINNIPYKKTKEFATCDKSSINPKEPQQQLQVRNYKKHKDKTTDNSQMSIAKWLLSLPFLIAPIIGFITSGIISIIVPKDKSFKFFTRFCLITHMLVSIATVYLYYTGKLDISMITKYINF